MTVESPILTLREAGAYLNRGRTWMLLHADDIGVIRDGGPLGFLRDDLDAWIAKHRTQKVDEPTPIRESRRQPRSGQSKISRLTGRPFRAPVRKDAVQ